MVKVPLTETQRRALARQRKANIAKRAKGTATAEPTVSFRGGPRPLLFGEVDSGIYAPLLVPDRSLKDTQGRYAHREIVVRLRRALAVHTLIAYHGILALVGTRRKAEDVVAEAAAYSVPRLLREGRESLSQFTMMRTETELCSYSGKKYEQLRAAGAIVPSSLSKQIEAELSAVHLISKAYLRCQVVLKAFEDGQRSADRSPGDRSASEADVIDKRSWATIQETLDSHDSSLNVGSLWEIAVYADINPAVLWPQHIARFLDLFEIARFLGRVDRGVDAVLHPHHLSLLIGTVARAIEADDADRKLLLDATREKLCFHFPESELLDHATAAHAHGHALRVLAGHRALTTAPVVTPEPSWSRQDGGTDQRRA